MTSESLTNRFAYVVKGVYYAHGIHQGVAGERELKDARVAGEILAYKGIFGRRVEEILKDAREVSGREDFYLCTWWPDREGEKSTFWRVIVEGREV